MGCKLNLRILSAEKHVKTTTDSNGKYVITNEAALREVWKDGLDENDMGKILISPRFYCKFSDGADCDGSGSAKKACFKYNKPCGFYSFTPFGYPKQRLSRPSSIATEGGNFLIRKR